MNKSITQDNQNDKQISESIKRFFIRFHVSSALKASNAYKQKGIPVIEIFQYLFLLIFSNRSMYMCFITGKNTPSFAKDTVYRFMKMLQINWIRFTTILATRIIKEAIIPLDSEDRVNEASVVDKRAVGYKRRQLSMKKGTTAMLELLKAAKTVAIPAKYVLFDSWFSSPSTLHAVKRIGYDVIGMVKKTPKMFFRYNSEDMSLITICNKNKKRQIKISAFCHGRSCKK